MSAKGDGVSNWTSSGVIGERVRVMSSDAFSELEGGETLGGGDVGGSSATIGESDVDEGALGALGDEIGSLGDGVFVSSWVKSTNNCLGGMMLIFGLLEALEIEALVEAMEVYGG
ncbi:hypothetical protein Tco_1258327 [Tanacetum coccineum]